jgi:hypothetical protein
MSLHEHMEHAAHAGGGHGHGHEAHDDQGNRLGRYIGITMATLGVLLALCSAMLGGARNKLISTMIEQTAVSNQAQAVSTKYRTMMAQLQQLHASLPTDAEGFAKAEKELDSIQNENGKNAVLPSIKVTRLESARILNTVTPSPSDVLRSVKVAREYRAERELANAWSESYAELNLAHEHSSEHYEWALLCSEIGIVICSIALLLQSRKTWYVALGLGALGLALAGWNTVSYHSHLGNAEQTVQTAKDKYKNFKHGSKQHDEDEELLVDIERIEKADAAKHAKPL